MEQLQNCVRRREPSVRRKTIDKEEKIKRHLTEARECGGEKRMRKREKQKR